MKKLPFISLSTIGSLASIVGIWFAVTDRGGKDEALTSATREPVQIVLPEPRAEPPAEPSSSLSGEFPIPKIYGVSYDEARELLIEAGWIPAKNPWSHGGSADVKWGNGPIFWERGYWELEACSGTGIAPCLFRFFDPSRRVLVVTTEGEEDEDGAYHAKVARYSLEPAEAD